MSVCPAFPMLEPIQPVENIPNVPTHNRRCLAVNQDVRVEEHSHGAIKQFIAKMLYYQAARPNLLLPAVFHTVMNCLSCGETENPESGEHVFSKWLLEYLQAVRKPIAHFRYTLDGRKSPHLRQMSLNSFQLRR